MNFVFDIAGQLCAADQVRMCGNTIEAEFDHNVLDALADAYARAHEVSVLGLSSDAITYSVQDYRLEEGGGCRATLSVNSSQGRMLH